MGNCLVTKLKGSVQNDNLPELNTIYLDYKAVHYGTYELCIECTGSITVESIVPFHLETISGSVASSFTLSNAKKAIYYEAASLPVVDTQNFLKISGDIYTITRIAEMSGLLVWSDNPKNSNQSLKFMPLKYTGFRGYSEDAIVPSIRNFNVDSNSIFNIDSIIAKCPLQVIQSPDISANNSKSAVTLTPALKACGSLLFANVRFVGNVANLPYNLRKMMAPTSLLTGALEDFVAAARAAGRTEGYLCIYWANNTWIITYGGVAITNPSIPKVNNVLVLQWDPINITIGNAIPAEMSDPVYQDSIYYWEPLVEE